MIISPHNEMWTMGITNIDLGCWDTMFTKHHGDAGLPLALPSQPMLIPILIYGFLVLFLPLYLLLALKLMKEPIVGVGR